MSYIPEPKHFLCLDCGNLFADEITSLLVCNECGRENKREDLIHMYRYAADAFYFGHQYRHIYQNRNAISEKIRFHIPFAGEIFAWIMMAALSGVIGNATYDVVKLAIKRIIDQSPSDKVRQDYLPLLELTDEQLGDLLDSARSFANDLDGLTHHVREAIIEEIAVDAMIDNPSLTAEIQKLMSKKQIKPKHKRRFAELVRAAISERRRKQSQKSSNYKDLWAKLPRN